MTDSPDPVQQAREWLAAQGAEVPRPEPISATTRPEPSPPTTRPELVEGHDPDQVPEADRAEGARGDEPTIADSASRPARSSRSRRRRTEEPDGRHDGPDADPETLARTIVLRKLTGQARTRQELAKALTDRDVPDETASAVLDRMEEVGLVDDGAFARDWVESRQTRRHLSRTAIRRELITKGVDRDHIDAALEQVDSDDEVEAARSLAEKKARSMSRLEPEVRYRRLAGALARRGFSSGVTTRVLSEVLTDRDEYG